MSLEEKIQQHKSLKHYSTGHYVDLLRDKYQDKLTLPKQQWVGQYNSAFKKA